LADCNGNAQCIQAVLASVREEIKQMQAAGNVPTDAPTTAVTTASPAPANRIASAAFAGVSVALLAIVLAVFAF